MDGKVGQVIGTRITSNFWK
jgi:NAD(P)-dependent dehydrogenase (short-subunit alcohol dehydrogenase family)